MPFWVWVIIVFVAIWIIHILYRLWLLTQIAKMKKLFLMWAKNESEKFPILKPNCIELFIKADVSYWNLDWPHVSDKFNNDFLDIYNLLQETHVEFLYQFKKSLNPWNLLKRIIFAPTTLLKRTRGGQKLTQSKIFSAFVTVVWWGVCFVINLYGPEIKTFITSMFK